jgi:hypothetical protein
MKLEFTHYCISLMSHICALIILMVYVNEKLLFEMYTCDTYETHTHPYATIRCYTDTLRDTHTQKCEKYAAAIVYIKFHRILLEKDYLEKSLDEDSFLLCNKNGNS